MSMTHLSYTLVVQAAPDSGLGQQRALLFAHALLEAGHQLKRVFFYQQGAQLALLWESSAAAAWIDLTRTSATELVLCSASAERYGVVAAPDGFVIGGLGALMEAGLDSDRLLTFV